MKISVIVPAYNEEKLLAGTLACIHAATGSLREHEWELIVCDNNSTDHTAELARAAGAQLVFEPVNQISRARNAGAACAQGEWLVFVDADCRPTPQLFSEMVKTIEAGECIAGGSTIEMETEDVLARLAVRTWNGLSRITRWAAGSFIFCQAAALRRVGGFNEELYAAEEIDLSRRLKRCGRVVILHRHPLRTSGRKAELYTVREMLVFMFKTMLSGGRNLRRREACYAWYDGRR